MKISEVDGGDGSGEARMDEGEGRRICEGEEICISEGWRQRLGERRQRKARRSRRLVNLVPSHTLKSELEQLRGRVRQAEKRYVGTSRFVKVFHGRLPSRARDFVSDWPVFVKLAVLPSAEAEGC